MEVTAAPFKTMSAGSGHARGEVEARTDDGAGVPQAAHGFEHFGIGAEVDGGGDATV